MQSDIQIYDTFAQKAKHGQNTDCVLSVLPPKTTPLGIYANNVANTDSQHVTKPKKKALRGHYNLIRKLKRQKRLSSDRSCRCGHKTLGQHAEVHWNPEYGSAKVAGVETCGSVWECPVCRHKIISGRADQLKDLEEAFRGDGGNTCMVTLTVPHYQDQALKKILGLSDEKTGISGALRILRQQRGWRELKEEFGYVADCRAIEVTYGRNGWHPHIHMVLYTTEHVDASLGDQIYGLWARACQVAGLPVPSRQRGVKISHTDTNYLAKWGSANEVASQGKEAKNGNKTVAQLEALLTQGDPDAQMLLKEYYSAMHGRKLLTWAGENIRKQYLDSPDTTDQELAEDDHGDGERLFIVAQKTWHKIYIAGVGAFLDAIEADKENGIYDFLARHGIDPGGVTRLIKQVDTSFLKPSAKFCFDSFTKFQS